MTNAQDLIDRASGFGRDSGGGFITPQDYLDWLNEAQVDLAARLQLFEEQVSSTTSGNSIALSTSPELLEIQDLLLGTDDRVEFISSPDWNALLDNGATPTRTVARVFDGNIELYPTPTTGTAYVLRFKRLPTPLIAGEDTVELPSQLHRKAIEYMKAQGRFKSGDFDEGNNWLSLYEQSLPRVSSGRERFFTPPISMTRRPSAMDLQTGARHI